MRVAGIDEAGRGALFAGRCRRCDSQSQRRMSASTIQKNFPVSGAPSLPRGSRTLTGVGCSRNRYAAHRCVNIYQASRQAMTAALLQLTISPDYLLIDAMQLDVLIEQKSLIKAMPRSISIAAASILAKTHRDTCMERWDAIYPQYGFGATQGLRHARTIL